MKFTLKTGLLHKQMNACIMIGIYEDNSLTETAKKIDKLSHKHLTHLLKQGDFDGKLGKTLILYQVPGVPADYVMLVGLGKNKPLAAMHFQKILINAGKAMKTSAAQHALSFLTEAEVEKYDFAWKVKQTAMVFTDTQYVFDTYKSQKTKNKFNATTIYIEDKANLTACKQALQQGIAIAAGVTFTKNLANQPSNVCTPTYLANEAKKLVKSHKKIKVKILNEKQMAKLGMNALLAVAKGSAQEAKLICFTYQGTGKTKAPIALVGKGITFDTGGISLKTPDSMIGMKYDMCGAATVFGTMLAAAQLKLPINLVGIVASAENMPGGKAIKPEDIVTSMSGQTIEILNTDAEGRLVLCDALTYCERYKPKAVIDIATLTSAVVIALGTHVSGLMTNDEPLAKALLSAGLESCDRAWQLPLFEEYQEQFKSPFADIPNTGGRFGGSILAGCFLSRFTKKFHWAHLDVAGTAAQMFAGSERYATGRPVPLLMQYLINQADK